MLYVPVGTPATGLSVSRSARSTRGGGRFLQNLVHQAGVAQRVGDGGGGVALGPSHDDAQVASDHGQDAHRLGRQQAQRGRAQAGGVGQGGDLGVHPKLVAPPFDQQQVGQAFERRVQDAGIDLGAVGVGAQQPDQLLDGRPGEERQGVEELEARTVEGDHAQVDAGPGRGAGGHDRKIPRWRVHQVGPRPKQAQQLVLGELVQVRCD